MSEYEELVERKMRGPYGPRRKRLDTILPEVVEIAMHPPVLPREPICGLVIDEVPLICGKWRTDYECGQCGAKAHSLGPFVLKAICASCGVALKANRYLVKEANNG
jgi:hypothetical protein